MLCYRAVDTTADEEGGGRDGKYEINSMGKPVRIGRKEMPCGEPQGKVAGRSAKKNERNKKRTMVI